MQSFSSAEVDQVCGAMQVARGGGLLAMLFAAYRVARTLVLSDDQILALVFAAYDRITAGDSPWIPGDGDDPASVEARIEAKGREAVEPTVLWLISMGL